MAKSGELNAELAAGLKSAKTKRAYFALVLKGGKDGVLIVSKTKVPPAAIGEAKKESGGSAVLKGLCKFEDGTYIFETAKAVGPNVAQAVKIIAKRDAGITLKAQFRVSGDAELESEEAEESESTPPVAPPTPPRKQPEPSGESNGNALAADWKSKLAKWTPAIKEAMDAKGLNAAAITKLLTQASTQSKPGGDLAQAIETLTECYNLATADAGSPAKAAAARWNAARGVAVTKLQNEIKLIVTSNDPDVGSAELELKAVMKQLAGKLETRQQATEMRKYLNEDDVVADVSEFAFDLKGPLVSLLDEISPLLPA